MYPMVSKAERDIRRYVLNSFVGVPPEIVFVDIRTLRWFEDYQSRYRFRIPVSSSRHLLPVGEVRRISEIRRSSTSMLRFVGARTLDT